MMDQGDCGFCYRLEMDAVKVLNKANLAAYVKLVRARFDSPAKKTAKHDDLEDLSHYATEPMAKKFEKPHPDLAARLWRAQGRRIVNAKESEYYDAALFNFEHTKRCFERAGLLGEWSKTVRQVRADRYRKSSFMPRFERLVEGVGPSDEPSFLDRAKAR
jgi:hypothetical protein